MYKNINIFIQTSKKRDWHETSIDKINNEGVDEFLAIKIEWDNQTNRRNIDIKRANIIENKDDDTIIKYIEDNLLILMNINNKYGFDIDICMMLYNIIEKMYSIEMKEILKKIINEEHDEMMQKNTSFIFKKILKGLNNRYKQKIENKTETIYIFETWIEVYPEYSSITNIDEIIKNIINYINNIKNFKCIDIIYAEYNKKGKWKKNIKETIEYDELKEKIENYIKNKKIKYIIIYL